MKHFDYYTFLKQTDLDSSLLVGYYGGGNYGDELLLEILSNHLSRLGKKNLKVLYLDKNNYSKYHNDLGIGVVSIYRPVRAFLSVIKSRNIIVGGGGLWGLDANFKVFVLSTTLFISKFVFRKNVFLLGVGYYNSTNKIGQLGAWLSGKASKIIVGRDLETYENFIKINKKTELGNDIAFEVPRIDEKIYSQQIARMRKERVLNKKTVVISLRKFKPGIGEEYERLIERLVVNNPGIIFELILLQPKKDYPTGVAYMKKMEQKHRNVRTWFYENNPLTVFYYFKSERNKFIFITPQFHAIITAILCNIPYLNVAYDNKVQQLLKSQGKDVIPIGQLDEDLVQSFINNNGWKYEIHHKR